MEIAWTALLARDLHISGGGVRGKGCVWIFFKIFSKTLLQLLFHQFQ